MPRRHSKTFTQCLYRLSRGDPLRRIHNMVIVSVTESLWSLCTIWHKSQLSHGWLFFSRFLSRACQKYRAWPWCPESADRTETTAEEWRKTGSTANGPHISCGGYHPLLHFCALRKQRGLVVKLHGFDAKSRLRLAWKFSGAYGVSFSSGRGYNVAIANRVPNYTLIWLKLTYVCPKVLQFRKDA